MALSSCRVLDKVSGHSATIEKLMHMINAERVPNCLLFTGGSGLAKKQMTWGFAQALLCEKSKTACGDCTSCLRVAKESHESIVFVEPEKGVIKIETARWIIRQLSLAAWSEKRIVIIQDAHKLNPQAANALLKSIEEPPAQTHFILMVPSADSVLKTIRSRSQVVRFVTTNSNKQMNDQDDVDTELADLSFNLWTQFLTAAEPEVLERVRQLSLDKETATLILNYWLQFNRDLWLFKCGVRSQIDLIHSNRIKDYSEIKFSLQKLADLSDAIVKTELSLKGQADIQLSFENLIWQNGQSFGLGREQSLEVCNP